MTHGDGKFGKQAEVARLHSAISACLPDRQANRKELGMVGEWVSLKLGEVCTKIGSGATPRGGSEVYLESGPYALIRSQNVHNDGFHRDGLVYIDEQHAAELANVEVLEGDVLLNITGDSVARVCQVDKRILPARVNQHVVIIRPNPDKLDARFLRYFLVSPEMQSKLHSWAGSGGTRNALTKGMIESLEVLVPKDVLEQRAITHILGTLDDKIELNRRISETLEAMARAIFKAWFVDFEPVRAKMEGRWRRGESLPGLPAHLYDLFPDRLVDSELGEVPEGWEVGTLGDFVELLRDQENPLQSPDVRFLHFSIPAFDEGQWPREELGEAIKSVKFRVYPGVILLSRLNPEIERVWIVDVPPNRRAVCSTEFLVLRPRPPVGRSFAYCHCRSPVFRQQLEALVTGTSKSHQRVLAASVLDLAVARPPAALCEVFEQVAGPLRERNLECRRESRTLAVLRDTLLPKLINGEIRVKDTECLTEVML